MSDTTLLDEISELRNPEAYGTFAAFLEELFPEARKEAFSEEAVIRGRDNQGQLTRRRESWDFENDHRA
jgi:hypothetical protein